MFNKELFKYDEETHTGYYNGEIVPSVTQLVDILYPYGEDIPQERLEQAAERGTMIHSIIEHINGMFDNPLDLSTCLQESISYAYLNKQPQEVMDYIYLLGVCGLRPFDYENLIFLLDEKGELICYGHYDLVCQATKDIPCYFQESLLYLFDVKTTSLFDRKKVAFQESIYALAYEQTTGNNILTGICGIWLKDGAKIIPLDRQGDDYIIKLCKKLKEIFYARRIENEIH